MRKETIELFEKIGALVVAMIAVYQFCVKTMVGFIRWLMKPRREILALRQQVEDLKKEIERDRARTDKLIRMLAKRIPL